MMSGWLSKIDTKEEMVQDQGSELSYFCDCQPVVEESLVSLQQSFLSALNSNILILNS